MITKEKKVKHIDELHFDHQLWYSEASFFADELKIYQNRLEEIASKNTKSEVRAQIEHFQNQFIIQKEQIDILKHEITIYEQGLAKYAKENPVAIDHKLFDSNNALTERAEMFRTIFTELKAEFKKFASEWM
jgi:hypothetical protein